MQADWIDRAVTHQTADAHLRQRTEPHPRHPATGQPTERASQRVVPPDVVAMRQDHQHPKITNAASHETDQIERRHVRPLQVLEHEHREPIPPRQLVEEPFEHRSRVTGLAQLP